ncbi:MAG: rhodanese-like domain-containing protein [Thermodesulfobacteriota bacterium]
MKARFFSREDLAWAGFLLILALGFGLVKHWGLVSLSVTGDLAGQLEKMRTQRRDKEFQGVKTINLVQAYQLFNAGRTLFIDARKPEEYAELHVAGAVNLPPSKLQNGDKQAVANFAKDRSIVVYCGEVHCDLALKVAEKLQDLGFTRVAVFLGGFRAWDDAGYPADTSK